MESYSLFILLYFVKKIISTRKSQWIAQWCEDVHVLHSFCVLKANFNKRNCYIIVQFFDKERKPFSQI